MKTSLVKTLDFVFQKSESLRRFKPRVSLTLSRSKPQPFEIEIFKVHARLLPLSQCSLKDERILELLKQGEILLSSGKCEESCKSFQEALSSNRTSSYININYSASLIEIGSFKKALDSLEKVCFKKEEYLIGMFNKALALAYLKQFDSSFSIILSIEKYADENLSQELKQIRNHCEKMKGILTSSHRPPNKSKSVLGSFKFPYITSQSTEKHRNSGISQSRKSTFLPETMPNLHQSNSLPQPLMKITNAYQNFITITKKKTTNILEKINGTNEITGKDLEISLKSKPTKPLKIEEKFSEIPKIEENPDLNLKKQLNSNEIREIIYEYCKPSAVRNLSKISGLLKKLSFFSKFTEGIISEIVKKSEVENYSEGQAIISQGELGDKMFIILTGLVNVKKRSEEFGGMEIQVNTLYQGETFGEMALLAESDDETLKRSASCVANDETTVITMSKTDYKHILLYMMKNDIHGKAHFFCTLSLFPGTDHYSMVPLAANIEPISYSINEIILEAGDIPQGLYIIYKGHCSIVWEGYILRKKIGNRKALTKAPKPFLSDRVFSSKRRRAKILTEAFDPSDSQQVEKASQYLKTDKLNQIMGKYQVYKKSIELFKLKTGDFFGGRSLVLDQFEPAKFTVIADSLDVKVFVFKFKHFSMLPECSIDTFRKILEKSEEPDCPKNLSESDLKKFMENWENFKLGLSRRINGRDCVK